MASSASSGAITSSSATVAMRSCRARRARRARRRAPAAVDEARERGEEDAEHDAAHEERRGRRDAADVRGRDRVAELEVAEPGQHRQPQRARERDGGEQPLDPARHAPPARGPAHPQVGARHRAVEPVRELGLVGRRRAAGEPRPGLRQAGRRLARERADGGVDLRALDRRGRGQRGPPVLGRRSAAEAEPAQRVRAQAPQPRGPGNAGRERAAVLVGALDGAHDAGQPGGVRERRGELLAVAPADPVGTAVAGGRPQRARRRRRRRRRAAPAPPGGCARAPRPPLAARPCPPRSAPRARARARRRGRGRRARARGPRGRARPGRPAGRPD